MITGVVAYNLKSLQQLLPRASVWPDVSGDRIICRHVDDMIRAIRKKSGKQILLLGTPATFRFMGISFTGVSAQPYGVFVKAPLDLSIGTTKLDPKLLGVQLEMKAFNLRKKKGKS